MVVEVAEQSNRRKGGREKEAMLIGGERGRWIFLSCASSPPSSTHKYKVTSPSLLLGDLGKIRVGSAAD